MCHTPSYASYTVFITYTQYFLFEFVELNKTNIIISNIFIPVKVIAVRKALLEIRTSIVSLFNFF
jgi:hypothetical protein